MHDAFNAVGINQFQDEHSETNGAHRETALFAYTPILARVHRHINALIVALREQSNPQLINNLQ